MIYFLWFTFFALIIYAEIMDIIWEREFKKSLGIVGDKVYGTGFLILVILTMFLGG